MLNDGAHGKNESDGRKNRLSTEASQSVEEEKCKQKMQCREIEICIYVYTHNHSVSLANWCLNSHLSSHHCLYQDHPHTVHLHCNGWKKGKKMVRLTENKLLMRKWGKKDPFSLEKDNFTLLRHAIAHHFNSRGLIFCQITRREQLCISVSVISFLSHPYQIIPYYTLPRGWRMHKANFLSQIWLHSLVTTLAGQNTS